MRYRSIDILRGLAIILMVQVHFVENLSPREEASAWLFDASMFVGSLPAAAFAFLSGVSYALWLRGQEGQGRRERDITRVTMRRGLFLFILGLIFNALVWLPRETFNWDILTLLGTALLLLALARHLPAPVLVLLCVMIYLISPLTRVVGDYEAYWDNHEYVYDWTPRDILFGYFCNGYFPVFPWVIFPFIGFVVAEPMLRGRGSARSGRWLGLAGGLLAAALLLGAAGTLLPELLARHYAGGLTEFPASAPFVLAMIGVSIGALALLHRCLDGESRDGAMVAILRRFSFFSLTVYVVHHAVILWPLWAYGAWTGQEDLTDLWRVAMPAWLSLALALVFLAACHFALLWLEEHRQYSLESLMRRLCD